MPTTTRRGTALRKPAASERAPVPLAEPPDDLSEDVSGCGDGCDAGARYTPVLMIAQRGRERVSRVTLPLCVCTAHRETFAAKFLTARRQEAMEASLRLRGREPPDWSRTRFEFVLESLRRASR